MQTVHDADRVTTLPVGHLTGEAWQGVVAGLVLAVPTWAVLIAAVVLWAR